MKTICSIIPSRSVTPVARLSLQAFTLIEMLAVISIVAVIVGSSTVYFHGAIQAMKLTNGSSEIVGALSMAQQVASSEGRTVEVRFYEHEASEDAGRAEKHYRSLALFRYYQPGEPSPDPTAGGIPLTQPMAIIIGGPTRLGSGIVMSKDSTMSSLLGDQSSAASSLQTMQIKSGGLEEWSFQNESDAEFRSFLMRPEGTSLAAAQKWFVTLVYQNDEEGNKSPNELDNFVCIQVDPVNGRVLSYRP